MRLKPTCSEIRVAVEQSAVFDGPRGNVTHRTFCALEVPFLICQPRVSR
jgi:hypothetical protein